MAQKKTLIAKKQPDPSELKIALDNRAFEIQLFWQRSNYFLVLMTALGIGTFSVKDPFFSPVIAIFATACSYFWFRTNLGSKFWQESWEIEVTELSKEMGVRSFEKSTSDVRRQVEESFKTGQSSEKRSYIRTWIDGLTAKKYSVTYNMILMSLVSTIIWSLVAFVLVIRAFSGTGTPDSAKPVILAPRTTATPSVEGSSERDGQNGLIVAPAPTPTTEAVEQPKGERPVAPDTGSSGDIPNSAHPTRPSP